MVMVGEVAVGVFSGRWIGCWIYGIGSRNNEIIKKGCTLRSCVFHNLRGLMCTISPFCQGVSFRIARSTVTCSCQEIYTKENVNYFL